MQSFQLNSIWTDSFCLLHNHVTKRYRKKWHAIRRQWRGQKTIIFLNGFCVYIAVKKNHIGNLNTNGVYLCNFGAKRNSFLKKECNTWSCGITFLHKHQHKSRLVREISRMRESIENPISGQPPKKYQLCRTVAWRSRKGCTYQRREEFVSVQRGTGLLLHNSIITHITTTETFGERSALPSTITPSISLEASPGILNKEIERFAIKSCAATTVGSTCGWQIVLFGPRQLNHIKFPKSSRSHHSGWELKTLWMYTESPTLSAGW